MSADSLLSQMDDLVSLVESSLATTSDQKSLGNNAITNIDDTEEKKYAESSNMNENKIGGLSLGNVKGKYVYQRFGYQAWTELAFKLETAYDLNYEINDDNDDNKEQTKTIMPKTEYNKHSLQYFLDPMSNPS